MTDHMLNAEERKVRLPDGRYIEVEHQVKTAHWVDDKALVLYDADAYWQDFGSLQFGQFPNLVAYDAEGNKLWTAELPTNESSDCYVELVSMQPLVAYSWKSFECTIDLKTGKIISREYVR